MDRAEVVSFIRQRGLAVVATGGPDGTPQAALVGVAGTDQAEIILWLLHDSCGCQAALGPGLSLPATR